jgi:uncharacterized protein YjdB
MKKTLPLLIFIFGCIFTVFSQVNISPSNANLQYSGGRIDFSDTNKPKFYYAGCSVTTKFSGTSLKVKVSDDSWGGACYMGFIIDGGTEIVRNIANGSQSATVDVASGLSNTVHTLTMFKRASQVEGHMTFEGLILDSGASVSAPAAKPTRRIEVFGDSVSEGVNANNTVDEEGGVPKASGWDSYANVLARALNAEIHNTGLSGLAVINGTGSFNSHVGGIGLETTYNKISCNDGRNTNWDFTRYVPHLVIMAMGINDNATVTSSNKENWKTKYKSIINDLRNNKYPDADFILTVPPLGQQYDNMATYLREIVNELNDPDVHYYDITTAAPLKHPYKAKHQAFADELKTFVDGLSINWGQNVPVTGVSLSPTSTSVAANGTTQLTATVSPSNASNKSISWSSSNTAKATVNSSGLVSGVEIGSCTITATTADGSKIATCAVTITAAIAVASCGLVGNFGFESNNFTKWNNSSSQASIVTDVKSGSYAARLNNAAGLNYANQIEVTPGYSLTFDVWAKVANSPTNAQVGIDFLNDSGTELGEHVFAISATNYTKYSISRVPPAGTKKVQIWSYKGSSGGQLFLDDFCLTQTNSCGLVSNYGFEADFTGWANTNTVASIGTSSQSRSGNKCAIINNQGGLNRSGNIAVTAGHKINFEAYAKVEGSPSNAQIGVDYLNASGTKLGNKFLAVTATSYTKVSWSEVPPSGTTQVLIWTYKGSTGGKLFLDDFCLTTSVATARIAAEEETTLYVFPNPTSDYVSVLVMANNLKEPITLLNALGSTMPIGKMTIDYNKQLITIDVKALKPGIYFINIGNCSNKKVYKFLKK